MMSVLDNWGYSRIVTPAFEVFDVLERGLGKDARAAAIRFVEPGTGHIVALRPDITPQIARVVATRMQDVPRPLRLSYEGSVMRMSPGHGQRELMQAGVELVGLQSPDGDAEILAMACAAIRASKLPDVALARIDIGHVAPITFVLAACSEASTGGDQRIATALTEALARKDKNGVARASQQLPPSVAKLANQLPSLWGPADDVFARFWGQAWPDEVATQLSELRTIISAYQQLAEHPLEVRLDLGDVRGFDYYTAMRFAVYVDGAPDAVLRGGRYNHLLGRFGAPEPAIGFGIDIEAIAQAQKNLGVAIPAATFGVLLVGERATAAPIAHQLRHRGVRVVVAAPSLVADASKAQTYIAAHNLQAAVMMTPALCVTTDAATTDVRSQLNSALRGDVGPLLSVFTS
jgi:ATP phosphoribosyltransferase regulatory subunit